MSKRILSDTEKEILELGLKLLPLRNVKILKKSKLTCPIFVEN